MSDYEYRVEWRDGDGPWLPFRAYGAAKSGRIYQTLGHAKSAIRGHRNSFAPVAGREYRILRRPVTTDWEVVGE